MATDYGLNTKILWSDRKRFLGMPITFTTYKIIDKEGSWKKLFVKTGLLSTSEEEVQLFRIFDLSLYQSLFDKMFNVGTITVHCNDESHSKLYLVNVKNPVKVRNMLAALIEEDRKGKHMKVNEFYM